MVPGISYLSCLSVTLALAVLNVRCNEIQRIYQSRIVLDVNNELILKSFEVVGLASVELESTMRPTYYFVCNTTLNNGTGITWTRDGSTSSVMQDPIPTSSNGKRLAGITSQSDLGVYTCLDSYTNVSVSINITGENPAIQPVDKVIRVMEGSNATLSVYVSGYPLITSDQFHWYRPNGSKILLGEAAFEDDRKSLFLPYVQPSDAGVYICQIATGYGNRSTTIQVDVYGSSPLKLYQGRIIAAADSVMVEVFQVQQLATVEFILSVTYYLDCNTSRNDGSGITWRRVGDDNPFQVTAIASGNGQRLSFADLNNSSLGRYECFDTLSGDSATVNITRANPALSAVSELVGVLQGDHALLEVYVSSYPLVTSDHISWYRPNGSQILQHDEVEFMNDGRSLFLINVRPSDAGVYRCEVNVPGTSQRSSVNIQLEVYENSLILSHPQTVTTVSEWTNTAIQCAASGNPRPTITWEREGGTIPSTAVVTSTNTHNRVTSVLAFTSVRYRDGGSYRCVADNVHTSQVKSDNSLLRVTPKLRLSINISGEPQLFQTVLTVPDGAEVTVECLGSGKLQWRSSTGQEIATGVECKDLYQEYISSLEVQILHIRNFSSSYAGMYICGTDLTTSRGNAVQSAVTLNGDDSAVTELTTVPETQSDSVAAIIGAIVAGLILAMMIVLFAVVILLLVAKTRSKAGSAPIGAMEQEVIPEGNVQLESAKQLHDSESSIKAASSIEKLNDDCSYTTADHDQMTNIL